MANEIEEKEEAKYPLPYKIELLYPVDWGKNESRNDVVVQRRLKAKDFKGLDASRIEMGDMMKLVSRITAEPMAFVDELDIEDLYRVIEVVNSFLPRGLMTGGNL